MSQTAREPNAADPFAGLGIVDIAAREGIEHWRAEDIDGCCP